MRQCFCFVHSFHSVWLCKFVFEEIHVLKAIEFFFRSASLLLSQYILGLGLFNQNSASE